MLELPDHFSSPSQKKKKKKSWAGDARLGKDVVHGPKELCPTQWEDLRTSHHGVQGSVLSPTLFLLMLDPLLQHLEKNQLGPCVAGLYVGGFAHADNIRTLCSRDTLDSQIGTVEEFVATNEALSLNVK